MPRYRNLSPVASSCLLARPSSSLVMSSYSFYCSSAVRRNLRASAAAWVTISCNSPPVPRGCLNERLGDSSRSSFSPLWMRLRSPDDARINWCDECNMPGSAVRARRRPDWSDKLLAFPAVTRRCDPGAFTADRYPRRVVLVLPVPPRGRAPRV